MYMHLLFYYILLCETFLPTIFAKYDFLADTKTTRIFAGLTSLNFFSINQLFCFFAASYTQLFLTK